MVRQVSNDEIKEAVFGIGELKSPGPDGFTAIFFKNSWDIVGVDICKAASEFFTSGQMLKELNNTVIALLPKVATLSKVTDYRPKACCNVLHKCISKILSNRMKEVLSDVVTEINRRLFWEGEYRIIYYLHRRL